MFDSVHGYPVMMEVAVLCVSVLAVGIVGSEEGGERGLDESAVQTTENGKG